MPNRILVYDPDLVRKLNDHPEVVKGRARRSPTKSAAASKQFEERRGCCSDELVKLSGREDLWSLYDNITLKMWSPSTDRKLRGSDLYAKLPAMLWDALDPHDKWAAEAEDIITDIIWAMIKTRTWKVREDGDQDVPLVWRIYHEKLSPEKDLSVFENVFAAAIRHTSPRDESNSKFDQRLLALEKLREISKRDWQS